MASPLYEGFLIDADAREIRPIRWNLQVMLEWLPGGICLAGKFSNADVIYVDDEALLGPARRAFRLLGARADGQPMMSHGFVTGRDHYEMVDGDLKETTLPPASTLDFISARVEWLTVAEALDWFRARRDEPAATINGQPLYNWSRLLANLERKG